MKKRNLTVPATSFALALLLTLSSCGGATSAAIQSSTPESDTETSAAQTVKTTENESETTETKGEEPMLEPVNFETIDNHKKQIVAGGYELDMGNIVQVFFEEHPEWTELYNKSWNLHRDHIQKIPAACNPETPYYVDEAFSGDIFLWDTVFMMLYDRYGMNEFPNLASMDNFYYNQTDSNKKNNGYIPREINEQTGKDYNSGFSDQNATNPPLLSWAEWECYQIHGDVSRFSKVINGKTIYERLCDHFTFIEKNKRMPDGTYGRTSGLGTGLDDSPNQGSGQSYNSLSIQQAQNAYYIALIAKEMGNEKDYKKYMDEHARISAVINEKMWDEGESMYSNLLPTGEHTNVSTPTSIWALIGRVATEDTAKAMVYNQALNSNKMFRPNGLATLAYDHGEFKSYGGYWKGGIWAPTSYQYIKGLGVYGFDSEAFEESIRLVNTLSAVYEAGKKGGYVPSATLYENYSTEYIRQGFWKEDTQLTREDFAGWTPCMSIGLILENLIGISVNAPSNTVNWKVNLTEHHTVSNLYFCHDGQANYVSLAAAKRNSADDDLVFSVKADHPFTLTVTAAGNTVTFDVEEGEHTYMVKGSAKTAEKTSFISSSVRKFADASADCSFEVADKALDYVYFTAEKANKLSDSVAYVAGKTAGKIKNVNTVGRPTMNADSPAELIVSEDADLRALGFENAASLNKYYYAMGGEGFMMTAEAGKDARTLRLKVSVAKGTAATLTATLSDASSEAVTVKLESGDYVIDLPYAAASDGRYLFVKYVINNVATIEKNLENKNLTVGISEIILLEGKN